MRARHGVPPPCGNSSRTICPASDAGRAEESTVLSYIVWGVAIVVCFYLGAKLTFQVRERKKKQLRIDFDQAKEREKDGRL